MATSPDPLCRRLSGLLAGLIATSTLDAFALAMPSGDRFLDAARGLSTSAGSTPLIEARGRAHLQAMSSEELDLEAALRVCPDERTRLAYLDALLAAPGMPLDPRDATRVATNALRATHPEDRIVQIDDHLRRLEAGGAEGPSTWEFDPADLNWRPFTWSPDSPADVIARLSPEHRQTLLRKSRPGDRPGVIAAVLAATNGRPDDETAAMIDWNAAERPGEWSAIFQELDRRRAGAALIALLEDRPGLVDYPEHRVRAAIVVGRVRPEIALTMIGGEASLSRLPASVAGLIREALAEGLREDPDPDSWRTQIALVDGLDRRLAALLSLERNRDDSPDPDRTLESITSLRTVGPGRLTADLVQGRTSAEAVVRSLTDLLLTGRHEVAYSILAPNTTEPDRAADHWLPARITLLGLALMEADASPDAWIPLIEATRRLSRLDAQLAALRAIAATYGRRHDPTDLPPDIRGTLDDTLIEIALRD
ncbi:MAG: hypothetical protein VX672_06140 [Planctomycetota bacterium]|nr:hypothetical protein [Planctomycetota bacterium]